LVEVDLLRGGQHATAVPEDLLRERAGHFDYHTCVTQATRPPTFFTYPFDLQEPLPMVHVPLRGGVSVSLDLQAVLSKCLEEADYERHDIYDDLRNLVPPLTVDQTRWALRLLRAGGISAPRRRAN
jgi:hypothetical protein